jgi:hypothetical protein
MRIGGGWKWLRIVSNGRLSKLRVMLSRCFFAQSVRANVGEFVDAAYPVLATCNFIPYDELHGTESLLRN